MNSRKRILVVDDERDVLEAISFYLFANGFEVTKATSGQHMVDLLRDYKPDVILVDYMMPEMDGVKALEACQEMPRLKGIPVILMSASPEPESKTAKWNSFLRKPFTIDQVLHAVAASFAPRESAAGNLS